MDPPEIRSLLHWNRSFDEDEWDDGVVVVVVEVLAMVKLMMMGVDDTKGSEMNAEEDPPWELLFSKREKWRRWRRGWWWFQWRELSPAKPRRVLVETMVAGYCRGGGEFVVQSRRPWVSREGVSWGVGNENEPPEPLGNSRLESIRLGQAQK
ncbi:hypothetical protein LR48_Vigan04g102500 [Vigna angularis]|uniref:Uncharacterized protein n=1 Tax=Phaseolus angularis TaxID=3914 RepID=A0A0L9UE46_PHAAN|nr:hypothetical protein LR48_Vigan04g102500 [Vigna angularis]